MRATTLTYHARNNASNDDAGNDHVALTLLDPLKSLPMELAVAGEATRHRRRTRLKLPAAIPAPLAMCHGLQRATRNTKDVASARFDVVHAPDSV